MMSMAMLSVGLAGILVLGPSCSTVERTNSTTSRTVQPGDTLVVRYLGIPRPVTRSCEVSTDGIVNLIEMDPCVVAGKTLAAVEREIEARYHDKGYASMRLRISFLENGDGNGSLNARGTSRLESPGRWAGP
jgi:protein involved in polysaccharide export with SLBB domain